MSGGLFSELASKYSVLYVEDERDTRESVSKTLKRLGFANLYEAQNGLEGLAVFKEKRPEIVISDIQMPAMNGLDMIKEIYRVSPETHVILTTAFSDQDYFMRSIELKVDKYIIKPINMDEFFEAIKEACVQLEQKRLATAYLAKEAREKLESVIKNATSVIADASPNPVILFRDGRLAYVNDAFLSLLSHMDLSPAIDGGYLPDVFEKKSGYLGHLYDYDDTPNKVNKACIKNAKGKDRIFEIVKKEAGIEGENLQIYFFVDITLLEYERIKLKLYGNAVQKELISKRFEEHKKAAVTEEAKASKPQIQKITTQKLSAMEYVSEIDAAVLEQMEELHELESEMGDDLALFAERKDGAYLRSFADRLARYAGAMKMLFEFEELSFAIKNISELLYENSLDLSSKNIDKIVMYCGAISGDLAGWRSGIFIDKNAIDIHYLDDSLYSSCLQLEFEFKGVPLEEEGGDLELF